MKILLPFIIISTCIILLGNTHKCIHDTLNVSLHTVPTSTPKGFPLGDKKISQQEYKNIRIHADFTCKII